MPVGYRGLLNFYEWCYEKGIPVVAVITGGESITYVGSKKVSPGRIASLILIRVVDIPLARMYCTINETTVEVSSTICSHSRLWNHSVAMDMYKWR